MKTFVCTAYHNALITIKTCRGKIANLKKHREMVSKEKRNDFVKFGPIDGSMKCGDCKRGKRLMKELIKNESLDDK